MATALSEKDVLEQAVLHQCPRAIDATNQGFGGSVRAHRDVVELGARAVQQLHRDDRAVVLIDLDRVGAAESSGADDAPPLKRAVGVVAGKNRAVRRAR